MTKLPWELHMYRNKCSDKPISHFITKAFERVNSKFGQCLIIIILQKTPANIWHLRLSILLKQFII